jgi:hypothetical protein
MNSPMTTAGGGKRFDAAVLQGIDQAACATRNMQKDLLRQAIGHGFVWRTTSTMLIENRGEALSAAARPSTEL